MKKRVVITGIGILCGNAKGREDYWQALKEGRVGYRPITFFDTAEYPVKVACEITDFDPKIYMGPKGLRTLDRSTTLVVSAAKQAKLQGCAHLTDFRDHEVSAQQLPSRLALFRRVRL